MTGWENPLLIVADAARSGLTRVALFFVACWIGTAIALISADFTPPLGGALLLIPIYWFVSIFFGLAQGWGFVGYVLLFILLVSLIQTEERTGLTLLIVALVQAAESARLLAAWGTMNWWIFGVFVALLVATGAGVGWLHRHGAALRQLRRERRREGYCVACGYDLRATIAAGREACPECGEEIPAFTIRSVRAQQTAGGTS